MGLISAALGAASGALADSWRDYFYCDSLPTDILLKKADHRQGRRSSNNKGDPDIISNGSIVAVADGQCMIIVDQGKVVEFCAEPGEFVYDTSSEPSLFYGNLGTSILDTFKQIGKRITFGGDTARVQRVYYFNTKEVIGNKYGTANPIPFKIVDPDINFKFTVRIRCHGEYSYKIVNPLLFYQSLAGNVGDVYKREQIDSTLKSELLTALQPAMGKLTRISYEELPMHTMELSQALNEVLSSSWTDTRGLAIAAFGVSSVTADPDDEQKLQQAQMAFYNSNAAIAAGTTVTAQAQAMQDAAKNSAGAMTGFMGLGMAQNAGGVNAAQLFQVAAQQQAAQQAAAPAPAPAAPAAPGADSWTCPKCGKANTGKFCADCGEKKPEPKPAEGEWTCPNCGKKNTGKFCADCGSKKPEDKNSWTCPSCGTENKGKFCANCGTKKPAGVPQYKCDKCGWEPEDPANPPKFCPNCGDPFGDEDITNK